MFLMVGGREWGIPKITIWEQRSDQHLKKFQNEEFIPDKMTKIAESTQNYILDRFRTFFLLEFK